MQRSRRISRALIAVASNSLLVTGFSLVGACANNDPYAAEDAQWRTDDGGYGGTGRFNPVGSDGGSDDLSNNAGQQSY